MHYPWWYVPGATAPMVIAFVAVLHVFIAQFAVGGGFLLAVETSRAHRRGDTAMLLYLHRFTRFFLLLTLVVGATTGFGIWWTIGLATPLTTEVLIHTFVFAWGAEWVAFLVEVVSILLFYYCWGRIRPETHTRLGWVYAVTAWISLLVVTGITGFQANPGTWPESGGFWRAWLNPQLLPQTLARTGGSVLTGTLVLYAHAAFVLRAPADQECRNALVGRIARFTLPAAVLIGLGGLGWFAALPESGRAIVEGVGAMNIFFALTLSMTVLVLALTIYAPIRHPKQVSFAFAVALLVLGFMAFATSEFLREATRKPYTVTRVVYGSGILTSELEATRERGILGAGVWTSAYAARRYPSLVENGRVVPARALALDAESRRDLGRTLFLHHCNDCHAIRGYAGITGLIRGWAPDMIEDLIGRPDRYHYFMPPWSGSEAEILLLRDYLVSIAPPHPMGGQ